MKIDMNKDFEREFASTLWKGLNGRELLTGTAALLGAAGVVVPVWYLTGIPINICVYIGFPVMAVIGAVGIWTYQGATVFELLRELKYFRKTRELSYEAEECRGSQAFTMKDRERKGGKDRWQYLMETKRSQ